VYAAVVIVVIVVVRGSKPARAALRYTFFFFSSFALTASLTPLPQWHHDDLHCKQRNNQTNNDLILKVSSKRK
jgi:hypothetical protein